MKIFTSNVRGLVKNWDTINSIDNRNHDTIMLNEIWQVRNYENINIMGFKLASIYQRDNQRGGGAPNLCEGHDGLQVNRITNRRGSH